MGLADTHDPHRQRGAQVRVEWGPTGARALVAAGDVDVAVVVDVLSFTTTLTVALERGITVWPFRWKDARAAAFAAEHDAVLAVGRLEAAREAVGGVSLSPVAMARVEGIRRLVLPSPNGSTIATHLADAGATVVAASLRNATAVARWLREGLAGGGTVAVVAAGERWADGSLRPAVEDLWGAGAVVAALVDGGQPSLGLSPEARVAEASFRAVHPRLGEELLGCASGRELVATGFAADVRVAGEVDVSAVVPVLVDGAFRA